VESSSSNYVHPDRNLVLGERSEEDEPKVRKFSFATIPTTAKVSRKDDHMKEVRRQNLIKARAAKAAKSLKKRTEKQKHTIIIIVSKTKNWEALCVSLFFQTL